MRRYCLSSWFAATEERAGGATSRQDLSSGLWWERRRFKGEKRTRDGHSLPSTHRAWHALCDARGLERALRLRLPHPRPRCRCRRQGGFGGGGGQRRQPLLESFSIAPVAAFVGTMWDLGRLDGLYDTGWTVGYTVLPTNLPEGPHFVETFPDFPWRGMSVCRAVGLQAAPQIFPGLNRDFPQPRFPYRCW